MSEMVRLRRIMEQLRGPQGCPWDREQTLESLRTYLVEEAHEVIEAIDAGSLEALREELGDLLLQIIFQARLAEERGAFDIESVMKGIGDKIVSRHPHVFASGRLDNADQVLQQWEQLKADERRGRKDASMFAGVPEALPALLKALRISSKAARVGFDWSDAAGVWSKIEEEMGELGDAVRRGDRAAVAEEIGDLLFTIANLARHEDVDPEQALQAANRKFIERFRYVEEAMAREGGRPAPDQRDRMEALWEEAKTALRKTSPARSGPSGGTSDSGPRADPPRKSA
jgi:tetrapyrrole methylase family protein/MazG family protein